jgi:hypothetical protein
VIVSKPHSRSYGGGFGFVFASAASRKRRRPHMATTSSYEVSSHSQMPEVQARIDQRFRESAATGKMMQIATIEGEPLPQEG